METEVKRRRKGQNKCVLTGHQLSPAKISSGPLLDDPQKRSMDGLVLHE